MISTTATVATYSLKDIAEKVRVFIAHARTISDDGLTWVEFGELLVVLMRLLIEALDAVSSMSGAEKKEIVLEAAAALFDSVADKCVPLTVWPIWIIVRPAVRSLVLALAAGAIDPILQLARS